MVCFVVQFETDDGTSMTSLAARTVWLSVWHSDRFGHNVFLGDVIVPLHNYEFEGKPTWYQLQQQQREVWQRTALHIFMHCPAHW